ncbi:MULTISPECIES: metal ABC transporter ATP-binding protein [Clostridium]|uniref:Metal ABC transporter ATP-binding protein n=2 Tax=Clostridium sulfidigenes TaxID=318464 RepID=A0A084J7H0_9CLOT|nr:metal ABC transporter ATP-binding protein [Clostridium sulfidigenes]KEZ84904.1 metal ABC transporter ATP-binding protein [Clostridium sulfidigenes]HAR85641.1 metal ABC transporter ATP-binding protein [Clostridium sp.]
MIKIKDLCFSYNNSKPYIIDNLSLNIDKESYVSIIGANGSCKSTLIKLILNLLTPQKGSINLTSKKIGYVPQIVESFNSSFPITVWEMLNAHRNVLKIKDKESITEALKKVDMLEYKNSLIGNLSGGQKQKIFIARAILANEDILILDEPSTGVDSKSMKEIYGLIASLNKKNGVTVISVEHNLETALQNSSHILTMENGFGTLYTSEEYIRRISNVSI